jgi:predicted HAD superfamily Cof-like phosphohydrolase
LIIEEISELLAAFDEQDMIEVIDALSDILYVAYGLLVVYGVDGDEAYNKAINKKINFLNEMGDETIILDESLKTNYEKTYCLCTRFFSNNISAPKDFFEKINSLESFNIAIRSYLKQLEDELVKLDTATNNDIFSDTIETTLDIIYYTYVIGILGGVNLDESVDLVHKSNMSKLCCDEDEAKQTIEWYKKNEKRYDSPNYRKTNNGYIIFNESSGKILKNINYKPVNLEIFLN